MNNSSVINGIEYGPLAPLVGSWQGDKGMDVSPEPAGKEETAFFETLLFEAIGDVTNAESQVLAAVRYHQVVSRKSNNQVFHNETGYWMWDGETDVIMHSLTIPRGVCILAGGKATIKNASTILEVRATVGDRDWGIIQSPFMQENARTKEFTHNITITGDELTYSETMLLDIYDEAFEHTDSNMLQRV